MPPLHAMTIAALLLGSTSLQAQDASDAEIPETSGPVSTDAPEEEPEIADDARLGGVGRLACAQVTGLDNFVYLGQAADWALGYMAGRLDAGQSVQDDAALSPADPIDLVTGIAARCAETPSAPVIDAVREIAAKVFGEDAAGGSVIPENPPPAPDLPEPQEPRETTPPPPRPGDLAPDASDDS